MLKRLFIGLLILSALTSEGINTLPASIFNLYVNMSRDLSAAGSFAGTIAQVQEKSVPEASRIKAVRGASFVLSAESTTLLKLPFDVGRSFEPFLPHYGRAVSVSLPGDVIPSAEDRIFSKADVSPPFFML